MESSLPTVLVRPGEADRIIGGHPWIYSGSVLRLTQPAEEGALVQVKDHRQRFLGVGFYNSKSKINVRVLAPERVTVDEAFFEERIRAALALRQKHLPGATSFRVVNAESDFLSGLIVDKYEDVLVIQTSALGMDQRKAMIAAVLQKIFSPRCILERNDTAFRKFEGLADCQRHHRRSARRTVHIKLNGLTFEVDLIGGHKTGLYLDQQVNYQRVAELTKGAQVLDCFSFLGGFGLHAARAGAAHVHMLDQSAEAVAAATRNAAANGLAAQCSFETVNVFDWLKANTAVNPHERVVPRFDVIILDPPSFTRSRADGAGRVARLQGNPSARVETFENRRDARDLLLLASCGCRHVPGSHSGRGVRCTANFAPRGHLQPIARPSDHSLDSRDGIFEGVCV